MKRPNDSDGLHPANRQNGFHPAWWCPGPHFQTSYRRVFGRTPAFPLRRERWETPDDDFLDLDFLDPAPDEQDTSHRPLVLLLHGLEGSSRSKYILGMLSEIRKQRWTGIALNFRSCSGEINRQSRFYHSGETTDLNWVVQKLIERYPSRPLFIVGFSLGGSVLLKWLGENGDRIPPQLRSSVSISVPYDLGVAARLISLGVSRIYGSVFLKTLRQKAARKAEMFPGIVDPRRVLRINSYVDFDNEVTAPFHGFRDGADYWNTCSAKTFLDGIRRPTLVISAEDDPFSPGELIPTKVINDSKWLSGEIYASGGHVGFIGGSWPWAPAYWLEQRTMAYLREQLEKS